jgi:hypothetical protein
MEKQRNDSKPYQSSEPHGKAPAELHGKVSTAEQNCSEQNSSSSAMHATVKQGIAGQFQ